jgi:hypothetical protein
MAAESKAPGISNACLVEQLFEQYSQRAWSNQACISAPAQPLALKRRLQTPVCTLHGYACAWLDEAQPILREAALKVLVGVTRTQNTGKAT